LFCHVTKAYAGTIFTSVELVKELIDKTSMLTGLKVITSLKEKISLTLHFFEKDAQAAK